MIKRAFPTMFVLALLLLPFTAPLSAADDAKDEAKAFAEKMKTADEAGKVRLIEEFAKTGNPEAGKEIGKFISNRSTAVKVAAIRAIGRLKPKSYFGRLTGMVKPAQKGSSKVLATIVSAIGEYGNKSSLKQLIGVAKKWLFKDHKVASAAARALGKIPAKESVDELIKLLDLTYPRQSASGPSVSLETRNRLAKARPAIMGGLKDLTGWGFSSARAWANFWELEQKRWKPGKAVIDLTKIKTWRDPGYQFEVTQPDETWVWSRPSLDDPKSSTRIMMTKAKEGVSNATFWVIAYDLNNYSKLTADQKRDEYEETYKGTWRDIKADSWVRGDFRIGKVKGVMHQFTGQDSYGSIAFQKNVYVVRNEMMFILGTWLRSGMEKELKDGIDKALKSFKFID